MMIVKDFIEHGYKDGYMCSPDGIHWEPALPEPSPWIKERTKDAISVLFGRATAIRQTTKLDLEGEQG